MDAAVQSMVGTGAVLSCRFHALLAAGAAGVPAVAVAHESKLAALARRLGQSAVPVRFNPAVLAELVLAAVTTPGPAPAGVKEQISLAEEGFRLLRMVLSGGDSGEADTLRALPLAPRPDAVSPIKI
jgi:polysaccharide pyruvyl transferase WcaK-like protein